MSKLPWMDRIPSISLLLFSSYKLEKSACTTVNMTAVISSSYKDTVDFDNASRGFIAALEPCVIKAADGRVVWNNDDYAFLEGAECPGTANASLWRLGQLNAKQGLFEVTNGVYQVRGLDISNMTLVEGDGGVIVIDPLISCECSEAALALYRAHRGNRPVTGMVYTHSHGDHFGGARGVLPEGHEHVPIMAPEGFMEHAVSENVYAGNAMLRRAVYMYGDRLPKAPNGQIGTGIGMTTSTGTITLIPPNVDITKTGQEEVVDGVGIVFQMTPGTEAPSEMNLYFPQHRALCIAENAVHSLHNILTLRGALVRDARVWSRYLNEAIELFARESDVVFASHQWPTWGREAIITFLSQQRDMYAYLHDQTLRMINQGMTGLEIAEEISLPPTLQGEWNTRGYYGSVSHNVKAIYQRYMGWYDGNPVHLWEHPPVQAARRYVSCMGGIYAVLGKAEGYVRDGDLRFAATLLGHAVFAHPDHPEPKRALASVFEKLGHGAENSTWRNSYLSGAQELRGVVNDSLLETDNPGFARALSVDQLLDSLAVRLDGPRAHSECFTVALYLTDLEKHWHLTLSNGALIHHSVSKDRARDGTAGFSLSLSKEQLLELLSGKRGLDKLEQTGDPALFEHLRSLLVANARGFPIVTP